MDYEMAYQVRVVIDRIKFAIKHTEQVGRHPDQMREVGLQLLDALERLESADRHFQVTNTDDFSIEYHRKVRQRDR